MCKTLIRTHLSHIRDHVECDVRESLMEVAANHTDPRKRVASVRACLIESHHMSQMGQLCVLFLQTHLREQRGRSELPKVCIVFIASHLSCKH